MYQRNILYDLCTKLRALFFNILYQKIMYSTPPLLAVQLDRGGRRFVHPYHCLHEGLRQVERPHRLKQKGVVHFIKRLLVVQEEHHPPEPRVPVVNARDGLSDESNVLVVRSAGAEPDLWVSYQVGDGWGQL